MNFEFVRVVLYLLIAQSSGNEKSKRQVGQESCMQIYTVPKQTIVCEPSDEVRNELQGLKEQTVGIITNIDGINGRLDEIDPTVPKDIPEEIKERLDEIVELKQSQAGHSEFLKRLENDLSNNAERIGNLEDSNKEEISRLIEQQSELIQITLEKSNISVHDEYVKQLTKSTHELLTKLQQLEIDLKDQMHSSNDDLSKRVQSVEEGTGSELATLRDKLEVSLANITYRLESETRDRLFYYNLSSSHSGIVELLQTALTSIRENQAKSVTKEDELSGQIVQLQSELEGEKVTRAEVATRAEELQASLELVQDRVFQLKEELFQCRNDTGELGEKIDKVVAIMKRREHMMPRTLKIHDCQDVLKFYFPSSGVYVISPNPSTMPIEVFCDLSENEGWTVLLRRQDGKTDFYRGWDEYKEGFGERESEYWLGLRHINTMTHQREYKLRVELEDWDGKWKWAEYSNFSVDDEYTNYTLRVGGYQGDAGDSLSYHNNLPFSTMDKNHDNKDGMCAAWCHGGWWYDSCFYSNLNGRYHTQGPYLTSTGWGDGVVWKHITNSYYYSLKTAIMKIKPIQTTNESN